MTTAAPQKTGKNPGVTLIPIKNATNGLAQADALFASIGDGVIAINESGKVYRVNKAALNLLGYTEPEIIGKWFPSVVQSMDESGKPIKRMERATARALLTGKTVSERTFYKTKYVSKLPVFVTVSPIMINGHPAGAIEVFRDASESYELDKMKDEFISFASHQLRTPLTAILTYTNMLLHGFKGNVTADQAEFLQIILNSGNRMNEIIDTLLNVSRMDAGNAQITISHVQIDNLVHDSVQEIWSLAEKRQQQVIINNTAPDVIIQSDPLLITEALTNLLSNAVKYTQRGGTIQVTVTKQAQRVKIVVSDNGHGIPASLQHRVFGKFFRAPNILQEESVGTGLGLYMVKQIIDNLGGTISFASTAGKGTTFTIILPAKPPHNISKRLRIKDVT